MKLVRIHQTAHALIILLLFGIINLIAKTQTVIDSACSTLPSLIEVFYMNYFILFLFSAPSVAIFILLFVAELNFISKLVAISKLVIFINLITIFFAIYLVFAPIFDCGWGVPLNVTR